MRLMPTALWLFLVCTACAAGVASAATSKPILWGVSDSGLEFGSGLIPGTNYPVPNPGYYLANGVSLIRVPFQIGRLQPVNNGPLAPNMVSFITNIITADEAAGVVTVLDPHSFGYMVIGGQSEDILAPSASAAYINLMFRLATTFANDNKVAIALMNEPHTDTDSQYVPLWNQAIAAIRDAGFHGVILVPHTDWSKANDLSPLTPFPYQSIIDPQFNWVLEVHSYLDPNDSGIYAQAIASPTIGATRLAGVIAWSRQTHVRLFLGETGTPPDFPSLVAFKNMLVEIEAAPDVFWGASIWGAGPWWAPIYPMRLDPINGVARPQFVMLQYFMSH